MKRNQVDKILINQTKRRNTVFSFACVIILFVLAAITSFAIYNKENKDLYVKFNENSDVDYEVYIKENEFFEGNHLEQNNQYIANLIDYINANFKYEMELEEDNVEYLYAYRIEANVDVKEKNTHNSLYNKTETILAEKEYKSTSSKVTIDEWVKVDFNTYNDLIKKFVTVYNLENTESTLNINLYVTVAGSCEDIKTTEKKESVISLNIPLTTNTVAIDISNDLSNTNNNVLRCEAKSGILMLFMIVGIISIVTALILVVIVIRYIAKTRTAETIYEKELKKILNNYGTYIQMLGNDFYFKDYYMLKVDSFTDMLEIRDTIRQPILMRENNEKNGTYFIIPGDTKLLYIYRLKVSDIEKDIKKKNKKTSS